MKIQLSHGNGAIETSELIDSVFMTHFKNKWNEGMEDSAVLPLEGSDSRLIFTTDSYVVKPLFFPGGDIGRLAVCGTVNDLITTGGTPLYLSASFIIEEGMDTEILSRIAKSMQATAREAGVAIVTGDTKVIEGSGGLYINTAGVGVAKGDFVTTKSVTDGDVIIVTGNMGDHYACILSSRMGIKNNIQTDAAPLVQIVRALEKESIPLHGMRDITRGGLGTVLNEIANGCGLKASLEETKLPVSEEVRGLCGILGLDPLYMGNEGKMLLILPKESAEKAIEIIRVNDYGEDAAAIGHFENGSGVVMHTAIGGKRMIPPLSGEGLPRIC